MNPNFFDYLDDANKAGILDTWLHSNGMMVNDKNARKLIKFGIKKIMLSDNFLPLNSDITDQNGNAVYGPGKYDRQYAVNNGVAGYSKTLEAAQQDQRVVGNPLVIKGVATSGTNRTDITISNADVSRLDAANRSSNILKDCRVLILLD